MRTSSLFGPKKLRTFRNLWCVRKDRGVWASADILQTGGGNFLRFCADVFYGRPLTHFWRTVFILLCTVIILKFLLN